MSHDWHSTISITITHVLSQMIRKYIPPCRLSISENSPMSLNWDKSDWEEAILYMVSKTLAPWTDFIRRGKTVSSKTLSNQIFCHLQFLKDHGGSYITLNHPLYPSLLKQIKSPPVALSLLGNINVIGRPMVSIVGSRNASGISMKFSRDLACLLVDRGYAVVSGGALGCDISAHYGSLLSREHQANTVVVFASGLNHLYPARNRPYFKMILDGKGVFLSERLWNTPSRPYDFPIRNRIICGLARKTIVIQSTIDSGSYLTANLALDEGRDVVVLKQEVDDVRCSGNRQLIEDGATFFSCLRDVDSLFSLQK